MEFAKAFKGSRQLVWSPGLKAAVGVAEVDDTAAAADEVAEPERVANINRESWLGDAVRLGARHRRARILDAAETDGAAGVAAVVADGGRDDTPQPADAVIEDELDQPLVGGGDDFDKVGHPENLSVGDGPKGNTVRMKRLSSVSTGNGDYHGDYAKKVADYAKKMRCGPIPSNGFD